MTFDFFCILYFNLFVIVHSVVFPHSEIMSMIMIIKMVTIIFLKISFNFKQRKSTVCQDSFPGMATGIILLN